ELHEHECRNRGLERIRARKERKWHCYADVDLECNRRDHTTRNHDRRANPVRIGSHTRRRAVLGQLHLH
ncbi:MAG: hypothetical protein K8R17_04555, partial [Methanosarcinales archaeon]|nr:hypothetical protein [Methanosarcinales archaeon]